MICVRFPLLSKNTLSAVNRNGDFSKSSVFLYFKYQIKEADMKREEEKRSEGTFLAMKETNVLSLKQLSIK